MRVASRVCFDHEYAERVLGFGSCAQTDEMKQLKRSVKGEEQRSY